MGPSITALQFQNRLPTWQAEHSEHQNFWGNRQRLRDVHNSEEYVRFIEVSAKPNALTTREVEEASESDSELKEVHLAVNSGYFENCKAYASIANELCCIGHLVLRGTRIVLL